MGEIVMGIGILACPLLTADRMLQFSRLCPTYMREPRMTEGSFFIYIRMEPNDIIKRFGPESKRVTKSSGKHFNQT